MDRTIDELKAENARLHDLLCKAVSRMAFPPVTEKQVRLAHAVSVLNNIPKRSRYYKQAQEAIWIIKNAT